MTARKHINNPGTSALMRMMAMPMAMAMPWPGRGVFAGSDT
jgi:hypothetical protein